MLFDGITPTKFGWHPVAHLFRPDRWHVHDGSPLTTTDHEPPVPVLDQEDLLKQGIDTSELVPGAARVDALGSCTCNAGTASLAERYAAAHGTEALAGLGISTTDPGTDEKYAIRLYHRVTDQTGDPATEWPPTDCGSNGAYVAQELQRQGVISGWKSAAGVTGMVSLLQHGTVMQGAPWFKAWFEPDRLGFIDGQGTDADLQAAVASGVAGGHETCQTALERLTLTPGGDIDLARSHVRVRNSWSASWGDHGSYRIHLSTLAMLGQYADFKQLVV